MPFPPATFFCPRWFCPGYGCGKGMWIDDSLRERLPHNAVEHYFGMGIDTALPAPRSPIQIVSPAGSTPVGVFNPSLSTVTLALSPVMVRAEILPLAFS